MDPSLPTLPFDVIKIIADHCDHTSLARFIIADKRLFLTLKCLKKAKEIESIHNGGNLKNINNPSFELCRWAVKLNGKNYRDVPMEFNDLLADLAYRRRPQNIWYIKNKTETRVLMALHVCIHSPNFDFENMLHIFWYNSDIKSLLTTKCRQRMYKAIPSYKQPRYTKVWSDH